MMCDRSAYLAGFFDGEGCVQVLKTKHNTSFRVIVTLTQKNVKFVKELATELCGKYYYNKKYGCSYLRLYGKNAIEFLKQIVVYLQLKYDQVVGVLEFYSTYQEDKINKTYSAEYYEWCRTQIQNLKYIENHRSIEYDL